MMRISLTLLCFLIAGCSISPYYSGDTSPRIGSVIVKPIPGRDGQILRSELQYLLNSLEHELNGCIVRISLDKQTDGVAFDASGIANRLETTFTATVTVTDPSTQELIASDTVDASSKQALSGSSGEIILAIYSDNNRALLKKLAEKILNRINEKCIARKNENRVKAAI